FKYAVPRSCGTCNDVCMWEQMIFRGEFVVPPPADRETKGSTRRHSRFAAPLTACIRSLAYGEEVVPTGNISRGGISFKSGRRFESGEMLEVAVPYVHNSGNIFVPARIAYAQVHRGPKLNHYGVSYTPFPAA
ncbi:MAG: PilZ domain-containing protein, partial [Terriglobia bacterium]